MNSKFTKLAKRAGMEIEIDDQGIIWWLSNEDLERFAELIVQNCISQVAVVGTSNFENEDILWTAKTAIKNIKRHFGVEVKNEQQI